VKNRPKMEKSSEQMKEWAGLLGEEIRRWPGVTSGHVWHDRVLSQGSYFRRAAKNALVRNAEFSRVQAAARERRNDSGRSIDRAAQ